MLKRGRTFIAGLLLNALFVSTMVLSGPAKAVACPDEPPATLLQLYKASDTIFVGRVGRTETGEFVKHEEDYKTATLKRHFDISRTLKGESKKLFVLEEETYIYENTEVTAGSETEHTESHDGSTEVDDDPGELKVGDSVLLFLKHDEEDSKKLLVAHYADAIKKVTADESKNYEKRIRELNSIFGGTKVSDEKVVEWLVRLTEDPVTRWEGAFELLQAFENYEWEEEQKKEKAEITEPETKEITDEETEEEPEGEETVEIDNAVYARLLTNAQKQRLSDILLTLEVDARADVDVEVEHAKKPVFGRGDLELIDLVKRWGDTDVARSLVEKIRGGYAPDETARMMTAAAKMIDDSQLAKLAEDYYEVAWGEDDVEVEEYQEAQPDPDKAGDDKEKVEDNPKTEPAVVITKTEDTEAKESPVRSEKKADEAKRDTYKARRDAMQSKFVERAITLIAKKEAVARTEGK